jgi:uncharacterized protein (DUF58 family)
VAPGRPGLGLSRAGASRAALPPAVQAGSPGTPALGPADEHDGIRPWRRGDPLNRVVWKKVAHGRTGQPRGRGNGPPPLLWLDWQQAGPGDAERRLSRLCAWVLAAQARQQPHGLRLPGREWPWNDSPTHRDTLLQALARW